MPVQCCLNGSRQPSEHPGLPIRPGQLAADTVRAVQAGATSVHLHVKDEDGVDTLASKPLARAVAAVHARAPGVPVGVTTGAWAAAGPAAQLAAVRSWAGSPPDFASVNWHEDGAENVATALLERGIGVEAGLWDVVAVAAWLRWPQRERCLRVLVELPDGLDEGETRAEADRLLRPVAGTTVPILLHGEGTSCWPALRLAIAGGFDTRIGLEDTLTLPDATPAPDNRALVSAAIALGAGPARRIVCPDQASSEPA